MTKSAAPTLDLSSLRPEVADLAGPFLEELIGRLGDDIVSIAVAGDSVTDDFVSGQTQVGTALVLRTAGVEALHAIAPLGRKFGRKRVAAPTILTPEYLDSSRDVFPLEFLNLKLAHVHTYGEEVFSGLKIERDHLRLQVERELKGFLIRLRQGFLRAAGDVAALAAVLEEASVEIFPELRGLLHLMEKPIAFAREKDLAAACEATGLDAGSAQAYLLRRGPVREKLTLAALEQRFAALYEFVHALSEKADAVLG